MIVELSVNKWGDCTNSVGVSDLAMGSQSRLRFGRVAPGGIEEGGSVPRNNEMIVRGLVTLLFWEGDTQVGV